MSDFARFYSPPDGSITLNNRFLYVTKKIHGYEYAKKWSDCGEFRLTLSADKKLLRVISFDTIVFYDNDELLIEDIDIQDDMLIISGVDLNGILRRRKTAFNAAIGYDGTTGTTAQCIEHYINNNFKNTDDSRKIPITFDANHVVGIADEAYMAKMDDCGDVIKNLCDNAGIGYNIKCSNLGFKFKLLEGTDRSAGQSVNQRIILSPAWRNVKSMEFSHISSNCYNAIYSEDTNKTIRCHYRDNTTASGLSRRECFVSVDADNENDAKLAALETVKDNIITHSYKVSPAAFDAGEYSIGDIVSVRDPYTLNIFSGQITEIQKNYSAGQKSIDIIIGTGKQKLFSRIINNLIGGTQRRR